MKSINVQDVRKRYLEEDQTVYVDRQLWSRGGPGTNKSGFLVRMSQGKNPKPQCACIVGWVGLACGYTPEELEGRFWHWEVLQETRKSLWPTCERDPEESEHGILTEMTSINDEGRGGLPKEQELERLATELGLKLVFHN